MLCCAVLQVLCPPRELLWAAESSNCFVPPAARLWSAPASVEGEPRAVRRDLRPVSTGGCSVIYLHAIVCSRIFHVFNLLNFRNLRPRCTSSEEFRLGLCL